MISLVRCFTMRTAESSPPSSMVAMRATSIRICFSEFTELLRRSLSISRWFSSSWKEDSCFSISSTDFRYSRFMRSDEDSPSFLRSSALSCARAAMGMVSTMASTSPARAARRRICPTYSSNAGMRSLSSIPPLPFFPFLSWETIPSLMARASEKSSW